MKQLFVVLALCAFADLSIAQDESKSSPAVVSKHVIIKTDAMQWKPALSLPPGVELAVLDGDPTKAGGLFTMRAKFPAGYKLPAHWHPQDERVTVLSGALNIAMGDKFDESKGKNVPAGAFTRMPARMRHFAYFQEETILQLTGVGPWEINYVNPADDPRKK